MENQPIPFNRVHLTGREQDYIFEALKAAPSGGKLAGDGAFTARASRFMEERFGAPHALLTHSCTAALEMAAMLADIQPGDEVIMPSYTFVSSANAFVLRGGVPVFVDVHADTLNIDETLIEAAITPQTKAIVPVHYGGVGCEMDMIMEIAKRHDLIVIEDAAQCLFADYKGRALGTIGDLGCYSFHETKNIVCGEGGALFVNNPALSERAEIIREKGTNRSQFLRGAADKYTWRDIGSSYLPPETSAAMLLAQLEAGEDITRERQKAHAAYRAAFAGFNGLTTPTDEAAANGHIFFGLLDPAYDRAQFMTALRTRGVQTTSHYEPLHAAPAGLEHCRVSGSMERTEKGAAQIVRFPMFVGVADHVDFIAEQVRAVFDELQGVTAT